MRVPIRLPILCLALLAAPPVLADRVTVFAAASLKDAMDEIAPAFEAATGDDLVVSLAGSSALARQIEQGAPADVFISANTRWMDALEKDGLLKPGTRRDLLRNTLVMIDHDGGPPIDLQSGAEIVARVGEDRLAMALVDAVPAGIYGKTALIALGQWDALAPRVVQADNVRAALALVATGEARYGIVYATDARAEPSVTVIGAFPEEGVTRVVYTAAAMADAGAGADAFLDFLRTDTARAAFERQGFTVLSD